jgi:hypothetical protein
MGMGLGHPVLAHIPMHVPVCDHALIDKLRLREIASQCDALRLCHLAGNGEFHLAGKLGVLAHLDGLNLVPEPFAVAKMFGRSLRQHDLGMDHAAFAGKVVAAVEPVVAQPRAGAVGGGRHRATASLAADDLDVRMIDRHRDRIIYTATARRNDV